MASHGADAHLAVVLLDVAQLAGERVDVDQVLGRRQPQLHHREQGVPAREESRVGPQLREQLEGMLDAGGALVFERGWYLQRSLSS